MSATLTETAVDTELWSAVFAALERSDQPVTAAQLQKQLPTTVKAERSEIESLLEDAVGRGKVFRFAPYGSPAVRYWSQGMEAYARAALLDLLSKQPRTRAELASASERMLKDWSKDKRQKFVARLISEKHVRELPLLLGARSRRLSVGRSEPKDYLSHALNEICRRLAADGIPAEEVLRTARELAAERMPEASTPAGHQPTNDLGTRDGGIVDQTNPSTRVERVNHVSPHASNESTNGQHPSLEEIGTIILEQVSVVEPAARQGALVSLRDLRRCSALAPITKPDFDAAILALAAQQKLALHAHDYPNSLSEAAQAELVTDGQGHFFIGIALRN